MQHLYPWFRCFFRFGIFSYFLFFVKYQTLHAQQPTLQYILPTPLSVCDTATFKIVVSSTNPLTNINFKLIPEVGLELLSGSFKGITNISLMGSNILGTIPSITNTPDTLSWKMYITCEALAKVNSLNFFQLNISLDQGGAPWNYASPSFEVFKPLLVITQVSPQVVSGNPGETVKRKIYIQNTRLGRCKKFNLTDQIFSGAIPTIPGYQVLNTAVGKYTIRVDGAAFQTIGNKDMYLDSNETIVIEECLLMDNCDPKLTTIPSTLRVTWGCDDNYCEEKVIVTYVKPGVALQNVTIQTQIEPLECNPNGYMQEKHILTIKNLGSSPALGLQINLGAATANDPYHYMDTSSFNVQLDGNDIFIPFNKVQFPEVGNCLPAEFYKNILYEPLLVFSPGSTLIVSWLSSYCFSPCGAPSNIGSVGQISYFACSKKYDKGFGFETKLFTENFGRLLPSDSKDVPGCLSSNFFTKNSVAKFNFNFQSQLLQSNTGTFDLVLNLPCGFEVVDKEFKIQGKKPISYNSISLPQEGSNLVTLSYALPFLNKINDSIPIRYNCDIVCPTKTFHEVYVNGESCIPNGSDLNSVPHSKFCAQFGIDLCSKNANQIIRGCYESLVSHACDTSRVNKTTDAKVTIGGTIQRISFGKPDLNNDRVADNNGPMDPNKAVLLKFIPFDTLELALTGNLDFTPGTNSLDSLYIGLGLRGIASSLFNGSKSSADSLLLLNYKTLLIDSVTVIRKGTSIYQVSNLDYYYHFNEVSNSGGLPELCGSTINKLINDNIAFVVFDAGKKIHEVFGNQVKFEDQDKILFNARFVIPYFNASDISTTIIPSMVVNNGGNYNPDSSPTCGCLSFSHSLYSISKRSYSIKNSPVFACDTMKDIIIGGGTFFYSPLSNTQNYFVNEHRNLTWLDTIVIHSPQSVQLQNIKLKLSNRPPSVVTNKTIDVSFTQTNPNDYVIYGLRPITEVYDESYDFQLNADVIFPNCDVLPFDPELSKVIEIPFEVYGHIKYNSYEESFILSDKADLKYIPNDLEITSPVPLVQSLTDTLNWKILVSSPGKKTVYNYLTLSSKNNLIGQCVLKNENNDIIPLVNGLYELGVLEKNVKHTYDLTCINASCSQEELEVTSWWNCSPILSLPPDACASRTFQLSGVTVPSEIEATFFSPDTIQLCDTSELFTINLINADKGSVFAPQITLVLPTGLEYQSGSGMINFNNSTISLPDPTLIQPGSYLFKGEDILKLFKKSQIVGILSTPINKMVITFRAFAQCGSVSGQNPYIVCSSEQVCGIPTNDVARLGKELFIKNAPPLDYKGTLTASWQSPPEECQDTATLTYQFSHSDLTGMGDTLVIQLPNGIQIAPASLQASGQTYPPILEITSTNSYNIKVPLKENIPASQVVLWSMKIQGLQNLPCGPYSIPGSVLDAVQGYCGSIQDTCTIFNQIAGTITTFNITRPYTTLSDFKVLNVQSDSIGFQISISAQQGTIQANTLIQFYDDANQNGMVDPGESLIFQKNLPNAINQNTTYKLEDILPVSLATLCHMIAVIPDSGQCLCGSAQLPLSGNYLTYLDEILVCPNQSVPIGIDSISGLNYQWSPDAQLVCGTCPKTQFVNPSNTMDIQKYFYTLQASDGAGCNFSFLQNIIAFPDISLPLNQDSVCVGDTLCVSLPADLILEWKIDGTVIGVDSFVCIPVDKSKELKVHIINQAGCAYNDSLSIIGLPLPTLIPPPDTMICLGDELFLSIETNAPFILWSPGGSTFPENGKNVKFVGDSSQAVTITVESKDHCALEKSVFVDVSPPDNIHIEGPTLGCAGSKIILHEAMNQSVIWKDASGILCANCKSYEHTLNENTWIYIESLPSILCPGKDSIQLIRLDSTISIQLDTIICSNASFIWMDTLITTPGKYCKQIDNTSGCDTTICLQVEWYPPSNILVPNDTLVPVNIPLDLIVQGAQSVLWSPTTYLNCGNCTTNQSTPQSDIDYILTMEDPNGCIQYDTIHIRVFEPHCDEPYLYVPNTFTPNEDGHNDMIHVHGLSIKEMEWMIYNRWGERVFYTRDPKQGWDGTFRGKALNPDVYGFYVYILCVDGNEFRKKGNISLLK